MSEKNRFAAPQPGGQSSQGGTSGPAMTPEEATRQRALRVVQGPDLANGETERRLATGAEIFTQPAPNQSEATNPARGADRD